MAVGDLIDRIRVAFASPVRDADMSEAVKAAHQAREAARFAARLLEDREPKLARELHKAADNLNRLSKRMWSL